MRFCFLSESTVVDCTGTVPMILREGAVTLEMLRRVAPETMIYRRGNDEAPRSPGLKHRHYSPNARVFLIDSQLRTPNSGRNAFIGLNIPNSDYELIKVCESADEYAASLFEFFRECDQRKIEAIYCEIVDESGIGAALMDRLRRAAE